MTIKIFKNILAVTLSSVLIAIVILLGISYQFFTDQLKDELSQEASYVASGVELDGEEYLNSISDIETRVTWIASDGSVSYDNKVDKTKMKNHLDREEIKEAIARGSGYSSRYSDTLSETTVYYALKLSDSSIIRVSSDQYSGWRLLLGVLQPVIVLIVIAFIIAIFIAMRLSKKITDPLNDLDFDSPAMTAEYPELAPIVKRLTDQNNKIESQITELKQSETVRREFTSNVSHELKTPLTSISGFAELIKTGIADKDDIERFASNIYSESQRLMTLVNDIIKLSQLEDKDIKTTKSTADVYELAKDIIERLRPVADTADVNLSITGDSCKLLCNTRIMNELIYNLCDNAIKYNKPGGFVKVQVYSEFGFLYVIVHDNGIGIPREQQNRIFERFYRVDKSHSKEIGGTGLGLSIVKHSVSYHNAEIKLESEEGEGSKFTVIFPQNA